MNGWARRCSGQRSCGSPSRLDRSTGESCALTGRRGRSSSLSPREHHATRKSGVSLLLPASIVNRRVKLSHRLVMRDEPVGLQIIKTAADTLQNRAFTRNISLNGLGGEIGSGAVGALGQMLELFFDCGLRRMVMVVLSVMLAPVLSCTHCFIQEPHHQVVDIYEGSGKPMTPASFALRSSPCPGTPSVKKAVAICRDNLIARVLAGPKTSSTKRASNGRTAAIGR
jgi:hypothetical protein